LTKVNSPAGTWGSVAAPVHLNIEIANFLTQGVAVHSEEVGSTDLIAARSGESGRQERKFNFPQNPMVETCRR
jgi:hypothetical protein